MTIHVQYMVKCVGGGWLVPGQPLSCHGVATKFGSANDAHHVAVSAGWTYDGRDQKHRCPAHQTGDGHVHSFKSPREGGELPKRPVIQTCPCGEQRERPW